VNDTPQSILFVAGRVRLRSGYLLMVDLLSGLADRGHSVALMCESLPDDLAGREIGFPLYTRGEVPARWSALRTEAPLESAAERQKARMIHIHGAQLGRALRRVLKAADRPLVFTPISFPERGRQVRRIAERCAWVVALSEQMRQCLVNRCRVPRLKVSVVPPGVELSRYTPLPPRMDGRLPVVGCAAPLEEGRGQEVFLEAAARVLERTEAEFVVAGDGRRENRLRQLARRRGLDAHLTFVTNLGDYRPAIAAMDVFVRPTSRPGLGHGALEAMAMAKPVIAASTAGVLEIVEEGRTGLVVPKDDPGALATAIRQLIAEPAAAREMGLAARRRVAERFSMDRLVADMTRLYAEAAHSSGRGGQKA